MNTKLARALLRLRDDHHRRRMILTRLVVLALLFVAHSYFTNLSSPLKLIPQTAAAIGMGYFMLSITSLQQFKYVAQFIDWDKVRRVQNHTPLPPHTANRHGAGSGGAGVARGVELGSFHFDLLDHTLLQVFTLDRLL
jgi:hypothetical protein